MVRRRSHDHVRRVAVVALLLALASTGGAAAQTTSEPPAPSLGPSASSALEVAVHFSVAPTKATDTGLTVLTRWRSCGPLRERRTQPKRLPLVAHVVPSGDVVGIRVDALAGPDGRACEADKLLRVRVDLGGPLGNRAIVDLADDGYSPVVNVADGPNTGLTYSCDAGYSGGVGYTVAELLGPGLDVPAGIELTDGMRAARVEGDLVHALGEVRTKGRVPVQLWRWRGPTTGWVARRAQVCDLRADVSANQATASWRLRGARPTARSKSVKVWVHEQVCNGRPAYGRVAQPIWINTRDGIVFVAATMRDTVEYDGTYIDDPWSRWKGKPGVAVRSDGGLAFVDCPGIGPGPYTFNLNWRLGKRKLYDGAFFPPRQRWPRTE